VLGQQTTTAWMPDWYPVIKAAQYLGVAPWALLEQSVWWREKAIIALSAENQAQEIRNRGK